VWPAQSPPAMGTAITARSALNAVDFTMLEQDTGATTERLEEYKRFLALKAAHSDFYAALLSPSPEVDEIWHAHILDTLSYKETCEAMLGAGGFIHHNPRGGLGNDAPARDARRRRTIAFYQAAFRNQAAPAGLRRRRAEPPAISRPVQRLAFEIIIKQQTGSETTIRCSASDSIDNIKHKIQEKEAIPPDEQRLIFGSRQLEDGCTLSDYNIQNGATVHMIMRLRGC